MSQIRDLLQHKGFSIWTIEPSATISDASCLMSEHLIGALVVEHEGQVCGIVTERDVVRKVIAEQRDPAETQVADVMTPDVICCSLETTTDEARGAMRDRRIRHLPVADKDGRLIGLISMGDLNAELQADQERTLFLLNEYITGRT
jgi:CBS domain-containing protein